MNLICSIFLTFYMVFRPLIPIMEYVANYNYIVETLCINKDKPEIHCNGKCYLSKELAKTNDTESTPFSKGKSSGQKVLDIYILPEITEIKNTNTKYHTRFSFIYETNYSFLFLKHIFRPPVF
ncbi:hypothetical protein IQ37_00075 [Chryseobacterium piperi]|uniref:Uncharacterized protein n=1 Tax=Chryseobacterium piperi TaxID=558152 RepID=A0A086BMQ8_9FLAO|nr:hypothetical protein [Chryseobacterium piperi]ASW75013.1 hypothetical protein CJF12_12475 [Chryseobacterium piperi]KFF30222.1 hypothetical protein IQ37_00075 [Chryseobacterium piperi]